VRRFVLLLAFAVATSGCDLIDKLKSTTGPTSPAPAAPPAANAPVRYTAIGASDATGVGASVPCPPLSECLDATSYVALLARRMRESRRDVTLVNIGIPEAVLSPAIQTIARQHGRNVPANFVDQETPFVPQNSTLITIFGGANDTLALGDAIEKGAAGSDIRGYIDTQVRAFGADYERLVRGVQQRATGAFVIVINLPNMAGLPFSSGYSTERRQLLQAISVGFSREANRRADTGVVVVDIMCDAGIYDRARFSNDGFHPNDAGYAYITDKLMAVVNGGSSSPSSSCAQMTLVPAL
jgi:lysophospholipase L1-like esterase